MTGMDETACCKWFIHHLNYDQIYAEDRMKYSERWRSFARMIFNHIRIYYNPLNPSDEWTELVEFVDGNGFIITHKEKVLDNTFRMTIIMEQDYDKT